MHLPANKKRHLIRCLFLFVQPNGSAWRIASQFMPCEGSLTDSTVFRGWSVDQVSHNRYSPSRWGGAPNGMGTGVGVEPTTLGL